MSLSPVAISLSGSGSGAGGPSTTSSIGAIASDYAELIANGSNAFSASGSKIFHMEAGDLSLASPEQIGRVENGVTVTAAMVAQNQQLLDDIGAYCRANGISISIEAQLEDPPGQDWTDQWLYPAVEAGLPITQVEGDDEIEFEHPISSFGSVAADEAAVVAHITQFFPNISIGQWEGVGPTSTTQAWLSAYDTIAQADGLPEISYLVEDTTWNAPWEVAPSVYQSWELSLSTLAAQDGLDLVVLLDGTGTDTSGSEWVAQSEQDAASLAENTGAQVNELQIQTWWPYPESVLPNNQPETISNDAEEIAATFSLYQSGLITAQGSISISSPPQDVISAGTKFDLNNVSLNWDITDVIKGNTAAVVITDETGVFSCGANTGASVTGDGTPELVISGNASEIAAALKTIEVYYSETTTDIIDIEAFGADGRLADSQIDVLAVPNSAVANGQTFSIPSGEAGQFWQSATATVSNDGLISSEYFAWNATNIDPTTGGYLVTQEIGIHAPAWENDVGFVNGVLVAPAADTAGNAPIDINEWSSNTYNPADSTTTISLLSTVMNYNTVTGVLQSSISTIAPYNPEWTSSLGPFGNYLASGGQQVTEYNTIGNPGWSSDWSPLLSSVTTTYGSKGQVVEQFFQGGSSEPWFSLDNVFDPTTGALWEQIQGAPPVGQYGSFVSGPLFVTEFNTGDNPNWDYADWGSQTQVTIGFQDGLAVEVTTSSPVLTGATVTDAYNMAGGVVPSPTTMESDGTVTYPGSLTLFGGSAATNINTGAGYSTVYLPSVGPAETITSGGADEIWVGEAPTTITDVGQIGDGVNAQAGTLILTGGSFTVDGSSNNISLGIDTTIDISGVANNVTLDATGGNVNIGDNGTVDVSGLTGQVNVTGTADVVTTGSSMAVLITGSADIVQTGGHLTAWVFSSEDQLAAGSDATVDDAAGNDDVTLGSDGTIWVNGNFDAASLSADGILDVYGTCDVTAGGDDTDAWIAGLDNVTMLGAVSNASIVGTYDTLDITTNDTVTVAGSGEYIQASGTGDLISSQGSASFTLHGSDATISCGETAEATVVGSANAVTAANGSNVCIVGFSNSLSAGDGVELTLGGVGSSVSLGQSATAWILSPQSTIAALSSSTIDSYANNVSLNVGNSSSVWLQGGFDDAAVGSGTATTAIGPNDTVVATSGTAYITLTGSDDIASGGNNVTGWFLGASDQVTLGSAGTVDLIGDHSIANLGSDAVCWVSGYGSSVTAQAESVIDLYGTAEVASSGNSSQAWVSGSNNQVQLGDYEQASVVGNSDTLTVGISSSIVVTGTYDFINVGSGSIDVAQGAAATISLATAGADDTIVGFSFASSDVIDLRHLLSGIAIDPDGSNLSEFLSLANSGANETLTVSASSQVTQITLLNVGSLSLSNLEASHSLVWS